MIMMTVVGLLSGCSINVNDAEFDHDNYPLPRTATDVCRREVERSYGNRYRIAFDLPELSTNGDTQTVQQPFTMASRKNDFEAPTRLTLHCTVVKGVLTRATPG
jgi:hypothetical protein